MNLVEFLSVKSRRWPTNTWLYQEVEGIQVYVRISTRYIDDERRTTFEIASVEIPERRRGKGLFTKFLEDVFALTDCEYVYIENVLNDRLSAYLERNGWLRHSMYPRDRCYYKKTARLADQACK